MTNNEDTFALIDETPKTEAMMQEVFPLVDPDQVEKELREQVQEMHQNMVPEDVATHFFKMYYPIYRGLLSGLSNKDARRVAEHVVQWPLEVQHPKFNDQKALQAFQTGIRLLDCKFIMKSAAEMHRLSEVEKSKLEAEAKKQDTEVPVERPAAETATGDVNV